ncbi:MAG: YbaN family protein [Cellvibrionales bacterium]|nr:YbaN family protein [Cellvibrionales bacterium]
MLKIIGYFFLVLALIGILLPLLPTTPFLLVAAMCFAKSSPELHQKLMNHKVFGPILRDWEEKRCINCKVKILAISSVTFFTGISVIFMLTNLYAKGLGILVILIAIAVILKIPTCKKTINPLINEN